MAEINHYAIKKEVGFFLNKKDLNPTTQHVTQT